VRSRARTAGKIEDGRATRKRPARVSFQGPGRRCTRVVAAGSSTLGTHGHPLLMPEGIEEMRTEEI
jgi:hypothetical protein